MPRLPKVGGDKGDWGNILNNFLEQSHNADGTFKNSTVGAAQLAPNAVTTAAIGAAQVTKEKLAGLGQADGIATLGSDGRLPELQVPGRLSDGQLRTFYERVRPLDPRNFGAVGDGTTDDTAAIQACINAAGASGVVALPPLPFKITATLNLLAGTQLRGTGEKASRIMVDTDIIAIRAAGGQGQSLRNLKIWSTFSSNRTTFDIEFISPTKPVVEDVEIDLNNNGGAGGGLRFIRDIGTAGNSFMPQLSRVWVRNGHIVIDGVTDGKATDCFAWAPATAGQGAIQCINGASSWTFTNCDVVPPVGNYSGYYFSSVENIHIQGGLVDGSYASLMTGWGIRAVNCYRLSVRTSFWNLGRGALDLNNVRASAFIGNVISRSNKADANYPDINNVSGIGNTFIGNTHSCTVTRSNPGKIYQESGSATDNIIDSNTRETGTNYYDSAPLTIQGSTYLGLGNRPLGAWPRQVARNIITSETIPVESVYRGQTLFASNTITLTLPPAGSFYIGTSLTIKNIGSGVVTVAPNGAETIEGSTTNRRLSSSQSITLTTSGSNSWRVTADSGVATAVVVPPASLVAIPAATAWFASEAAILQRFSLTTGGTYRYANFRLDTSSGNYEVAVVRLESSGNSFTKIMSTGVTVTPAAGDKIIDLGTTYLEPGHYAIGLWFDNTVAQLRMGGSTGLTAMRLTSILGPPLASGIPATGSITWGSTQFIGGLTLT